MKLDKIISTRDAGSVTDLICPRCGADNLHHLGVAVFDRNEDAPLTVKTLVEGATVAVAVLASEGSANPSSRRDGLAIQFECEGCGGGTNEDVIELTIAQHKGSTEIGWRYSELKERGPN